MIPLLTLQILAIAHGTVIDMTGAPPRRDVTVVIDGSRIAAIGPSSTLKPSRGARVIDARGKYLIPGLWDMHVHTVLPGVPNGRALLPLYVANGVTGVRDMGGTWDTIRAYRRDIAAGGQVGPRIVAAGAYLDFNDQPVAHFRVRSAAE